jgi:hypothetical protein
MSLLRSPQEWHCALSSLAAGYTRLAGTYCHRAQGRKPRTIPVSSRDIQSISHWVLPSKITVLRQPNLLEYSLDWNRLPDVTASSYSNTVLIYQAEALWEPSMGSSHRLPNRYRGNGYPNRYQSNNLINRITVVTNNHNNTRIVASGVYTWVRLKVSTEVYEEYACQPDDADQLARTVPAVQFGTSLNSTSHRASSSESNTPTSLPSSNAVNRLRLQSPGRRNRPPTSNIKSSASSFP